MMTPKLDIVIDHFAQGDDIVLSPFTVANVPAGDSLADAWLTVKASTFDLDSARIFEKHITPILAVGEGGISGVDLRFDLTNANTVLLIAGWIFYWSIKCRTQLGKIGTPFGGVFITKPQNRQANS